METMIKGLDLEELEVHSYVELLPDRIEMRRRKSVRKRRRSGNVECGDEARCNRITIR
jgi:hypothetical protein